MDLLGFIFRVPYVFRKSCAVCISFAGKGEFMLIISFFHGPSVSPVQTFSSLFFILVVLGK